LELAKLILSEGYVIYENYVDNRQERHSIDSIESYLRALNKRKYIKYGRGPNLSIVRKDIASSVTWERINLQSGGARYRMKSLEAHAVQLLLSDQDQKRIGAGRISLSTEWIDDNGNIIKEEISVEIYKRLKRFLKKLSTGKVYNSFVGKDVYKKWSAGKIELAYDLVNPEVFKIEDFEAL